MIHRSSRCKKKSRLKQRGKNCLVFTEHLTQYVSKNLITTRVILINEKPIFKNPNLSEMVNKYEIGFK